VGNNKTGLEHRFKRGDDSVLNRDSSAERRLVESVALILAGDFLITTLSGKKKVKAKFDMKATLAMPLSVGGFVSDLIPDVPGVGDIPFVGPLLPGQSPPKGTSVGKGNRLNPSQAPDTEGSVGLQVEGEVDLDSFLIAIVSYGYLMEKASPALQGIGQAIGGAIEPAAKGAASGLTGG